MVNKIWGWHLLIDAKHCLEGSFTHDNIYNFTKTLVNDINMKAYGQPVIEHFATHDPLKAGFSMVQLIETSNITAHFVDLNGDAYFDIFSCMEYDENKVLYCINKYFKPFAMTSQMIKRG